DGMCRVRSSPRCARRLGLHALLGAPRRPDRARARLTHAAHVVAHGSLGRVGQLPLPLARPTGESPAPVPRSQRIFVNRNLRLDQIAWVGFDMDYTLAIYRQDAMDRISIEQTVKKMVENKGRPESLLTLPFDTSFPIRGLFVDKKLGNVLKMDRYR